MHQISAHIENFRASLRENAVFSLLALMVFVLPLAFTLRTSENFETIKFALYFIFTGLALMAWVWPAWSQPAKAQPADQVTEVRPKVKIDLFIILLFAFAVWAALAVFHDGSFKEILLGTYPRYTNGFLFYLIWAVNLFILYQVINRARLMVLLKILVFDSVLIVAYGVIQSFGFGFYAGAQILGFERAPSFLGNTNFIAMFVAAAVPLAGIFFTEAKGRWKIYYGTVLTILVIGVGFYASRGGLVGFGAGVGFAAIFFFFKSYGFRYWLTLVFSLLLAGSLFYGFYNAIRPSFFQTLGRDINTHNIDTRIAAWQIAAEGIARRPWTGVGFGQFLNLYEANKDQTLASERVAFDDPHNLFLLLGAMGGIPLLLCFALLPLSLIFVGTGFALKQKDALIIGVLASIFSLLVSASFTPVAIPGFLFLSVCLATMRVVSDGQLAFEKKLNSPWALSFFGLGALSLIFGLGFLAGEVLYYSAILIPAGQDSLKAEKLIHWARLINPSNRVYDGSYILAQINRQGDTPAVLDLIQHFQNADAHSARNQSATAGLKFALYKKTAKAVYAQQAIEALSQSLKISPFYGDKYIKLAFYYYTINKKDEALNLVYRGLDYNPDYSPGWIMLAKLEQEKGRRPQMLFALKKLIVSRLSETQVKFADFQLLNLLKIARWEKAIQKVPLDPIFSPSQFF